jgi:hypothetical protein
MGLTLRAYVLFLYTRNYSGTKVQRDKGTKGQSFYLFVVPAFIPFPFVPQAILGALDECLCA